MLSSSCKMFIAFARTIYSQKEFISFAFHKFNSKETMAQIDKTFLDEKLTAHIVVRIKSDEGRTIYSHLDILNKHKEVIFAKIGKGISVPFLNQLKKQISKDIPTYLFLAVYEGWNKPFGFIRCNLLDVNPTITDKELKLVPSYLHPSRKSINTWFKITTLNKLDKKEIKRICILKSGREISSSLRGTTAVFRVVVNGKKPMLETPYPYIKPKDRDTLGEFQFDDVEDSNDLDDLSGLFDVN